MLIQEGSIENLIQDLRLPKSLTNTQIESIALEKITNEFLNVDELSIETRAYLVKTTLPTVVLALEQLLKDMGRKQIPMDSSRLILEELDLIQVDKPISSFDSLNWIAQYLFRNNPRYCKQEGNLYVDRLGQISKILDARIEVIKAEWEAKRLAEEKAKLEEKERLNRELLARLSELKNQFTDFLTLSFKLWINALWRKSPGELYKTELVDEFMAVSQNAEIQGDTPLYQKVLDLIESITTENKPFPEANETNSFFDENEPLYLLDCSTIERWDGDFYVKILLRLMINWNVNDLTTFLRVLSSNIQFRAGELKNVFTDNLFIPKFFGVSVVRDWLQQLLPIIQGMDHPNTLLKDSIKKACLGFCFGRDDSRFSFVKSSYCDDQVIENDNPAIGFAETAYVRFMKCLIGEFGASNYIAVMEHIKTEVGTATSQKSLVLDRPDSNIKLVDSKSGISDSAHFKILEILKQLPEKNGLLLLPYMLGLIEDGIAKYGPTHKTGELLANFKSVVIVKEKLQVEQCWTLIEISMKNEESDALLLAETLLQLHQNKQKSIQENESANVEMEAKRQLRESLEAEAIKKINQLAQDVNLSIHNACEQSRQIVEKVFGTIYPNHPIVSRVAILETSTTGLIPGKEKLKEDESLGGNVLMETYLRIVACSPEIRKMVFGSKIADGTGIDSQLFTLKTAIRVQEVSKDENLINDVFFSSPLLKENMERYSYLGIPFNSSTDQSFGTMNFMMQAQHFEQEDLLFMERVSDLVGPLLEQIYYRQQAISLALSAKKFIDAKLETKIQIYFDEKNQATYTVEIDEKEKMDQIEEQVILGSSALKKTFSFLKLVEPSEAPSDILKNVFTSGEMSVDSNIAYVPVIHPDTQDCVAIIAIPDISSVNDDKVKEAARYTKILGSGLKVLRNQAFGYDPETCELEGERIDENARQNMMFCKIMLILARKGLLELDTKAVAELRSYRKPPAVIHRIIKGALYLFGHLPKAVKVWMNAVKYFTSDFVKLLTTYDPTTVQKKIRIKRVKKILKSIPLQDSFVKGSKPAQLVCEWLSICMTLRDIAVQARKSRPDIFEKTRSASSGLSGNLGDEDVTTDGESVVDDEDVGDEEPVGEEQDMEAELIDIEAEMTDDQGNVIKQIVIGGETTQVQIDASGDQIEQHKDQVDEPHDQADQLQQNEEYQDQVDESQDQMDEPQDQVENSQDQVEESPDQVKEPQDEVNTSSPDQLNGEDNKE